MTSTYKAYKSNPKSSSINKQTIPDITDTKNNPNFWRLASTT